MNKFLEEQQNKKQVKFSNLLKTEKNKNRRGHFYKSVVTPGNKTGKYFKKTPKVWTANRTKKSKSRVNVVIPYTNYVAQEARKSLRKYNGPIPRSRTKLQTKSKSKSRTVKTVLEL